MQIIWEHLWWAHNVHLQIQKMVLISLGKNNLFPQKKIVLAIQNTIIKKLCE